MSGTAVGLVQVHGQYPSLDGSRSYLLQLKLQARMVFLVLGDWYKAWVYYDLWVQHSKYLDLEN